MLQDYGLFYSVGLMSYDRFGWVDYFIKFVWEKRQLKAKIFAWENGIAVED